jgi:hypothetical protein
VITLRSDGTLAGASGIDAREAIYAARARQSGTPLGASGLVAVAPNIYELRAASRPVAVPVEDVTPRVAQPTTQAPTSPRATTRPFRLEVSNGNGKTGMAHRIAGNLKAAGLNPVRLTNQIPWQRVSEIQFTEGYAAEAASLAGMLGQDVLTIRNDRLRSDIKVRLVLGKDVQRETAFVTPRLPETTTVASAK